MNGHFTPSPGQDPQISEKYQNLPGRYQDVDSCPVPASSDRLPPVAAVPGEIMTIDNYQPSLAVTQLVQTTGPYPGNVVNEGDFTMAMVRMFAGNFAWEGSAYATGQLLALSQNTALFSLLGTTYGGDGSTTFALPDLQGMASLGDGQGSGLSLYFMGEETGLPEIDLAAAQVPAQWGGSSLPVHNVQPSLAINYLIRVSGDEDGVGSDGTGDLLGGIVEYLADAELRGSPPGYLIADGQLLDKDDYPDLFALIGYTYGGDNNQFFALPDLRGRIRLRRLLPLRA